GNDPAATAPARFDSAGSAVDAPYDIPACPLTSHAEAGLLEWPDIRGSSAGAEVRSSVSRARSARQLRTECGAVATVGPKSETGDLLTLGHVVKLISLEPQVARRGDGKTLRRHADRAADLDLGRL